MGWTQILHWAAEHAAVVSLGGILTAISSAYVGYLLTKSHENLKRLRDYYSASRQTMIDKCVDLLNVTVEAKTWARSHREELARLTDQEDKSQALEFIQKINSAMVAHSFKVQNIGIIAMAFCPSEFLAYPAELAKNVGQLLSCATDYESSDRLSAVEAEVDTSVQKIHQLIRSTYNLEMYDNLDPRKFRNRIKYGFTEKRRRKYRKRVTAEMVAAIEEPKDHDALPPGGAR